MVVENKTLKTEFESGKLVISLTELETLNKEDNFICLYITNKVNNKDEVASFIQVKNGNLYFVEDFDRSDVEVISVKDYIKEVPSFVPYKNIEEAIKTLSLTKLFNMGLIAVHTNNKDEYISLLGYIKDDEIEIGTIWSKNTNIFIRGSKVSYTNLDNIHVVEYADFVK